jgi:hypothetical protein
MTDLDEIPRGGLVALRADRALTCSAGVAIEI